MLGIDDEWAAYQLDAAVLVASLEAAEPQSGKLPGGDWRSLVRR